MSHISSLAIAVALAFSAGEAAASVTRSVPLVIPFAVQVKGTVLQVDISIQEERTYNFALQLAVSGDDDSRRRIAQLAGNGARRADGTPADTGLPIPLELTIQRLPSHQGAPIFQKRLSEFELRAHSTSYYSKQVAGVVLGPGSYRVRLEALQDIPELQGTPVKLEISYRRK